jgi:hypothetical protein
MMKCCLSHFITHPERRDIYTTSFFHCMLFTWLSRNSKSSVITSPAVICGLDCLRLQELRDIRNSIPLRTGITVEEMKNDPDKILPYLPEKLIPYYDVLRKLHISFADLNRECIMCAGRSVEAPLEKAPATEMCYVRKSW